MADLSPAAQAILDATCRIYHSAIPARTRAAAILRIAADQGENFYDPHEGKVSVVRIDLLIAIADELEGKNG
jgi:hypothetical protein